MRELCVAADDPEVDVTATRGTRLVLPRSLFGGERASDVTISNLIAEREKSKSFFWSVELIPGTTRPLQVLLEQSLEQLTHLKPCFVSVTWHARHFRVVKIGDKSVPQHPALDLAKTLQDAYGIPVLMHLAAGKMKLEEVHAVLKSCLDSGIRNVLALRGDEIDRESDFKHASDLVLYIRNFFGSNFNIGVAGYPYLHPEAKSKAEDLLHLKEKVDAGADFILTQMITSFEEYSDFKKQCDLLGIKVPIIPSIFLIKSYSALNSFIRICNIKVPQKCLAELEELNNEMKESQYGLNLLKNLLTCLLDTTYCPGAHILSLNRVSEVSKLLRDLRLCQRR